MIVNFSHSKAKFYFSNLSYFLYQNIGGIKMPSISAWFLAHPNKIDPRGNVYHWNEKTQRQKKRRNLSKSPFYNAYI